MRQRTELSERPQSFTVIKEDQMAIITFYTDVEEEVREDTTVYTAVAWDMTVPWQDNLEERIMMNFNAWFQKAQSLAYDLAAAAARAKRNELLSASDSSMALDRLGLTVPSGSTFTAWLTFLRNLGSALTGEFAKYRQALRDLPEQPGFPYEIEWPDLPK